MDKYTATEQAYKNGYEQGKKDAVIHGYWNHNPIKRFSLNEYYMIPPIGEYECSCCRARSHTYSANYCHYCGAKMNGEG